MIMFNEFLDEFKVLHVSCVELLVEKARNEDNEKWYQLFETVFRSVYWSLILFGSYQGVVHCSNLSFTFTFEG